MQSILDMQNSVGRTPLHAAAAHGHLIVVKQLVSAGVNINILDNDGKTAFDLGKSHAEVAAILGHRMSAKFQEEGKFKDALKIYEELLQIQEETLGCNHLETNTTRDHVRQFRSLMYLMGFSDTKPPSFMKDMEAKNDEGKTPLHAAAASGQLPFVKLLVRAGVNINILDNEGKTAFDLGKNHVEVASFLGHKMNEKLQKEMKYEDALKILEELLTIQDGTLGADHCKTARTRNRIQSLHSLLYVYKGRSSLQRIHKTSLRSPYIIKN